MNFKGRTGSNVIFSVDPLVFHQIMKVEEINLKSERYNIRRFFVFSSAIDIINLIILQNSVEVSRYVSHVRIKITQHRIVIKRGVALTAAYLIPHLIEDMICIMM